MNSIEVKDMNRDGSRKDEDVYLYGNSLFQTPSGENKATGWLDMDENEDFNRIRRIVLSIKGRMTGYQLNELRLIETDLDGFEQDIQEIGSDRLSSAEQEEYSFKKNVLEYAIKHGYRLNNKRFKEGNGNIIENKNNNIEIGVSSKNKESNSSQDREWQNLQQHRATVFSNLKKGFNVEEKQYQYVFKTEDGISFIHGDDDQIEELKGEDEDLLDEVELEEALDKEEKRVKTIEETRRSLPVYGYREQLLEAISKNKVLIVVGETGSGKTTQLPQYLYESGYCKNGKMVGCTQPRRVAAISVATRVADEVGCKLGDEVGYNVRFDSKSSPKTRIKYMTDGMLLREFLNDVNLDSYSAMMIDEAHERTLSTDILLGLLKEIIKDRNDFRILISSATINAQKFSDYFEGAPIFNVPGRRFPVDIYYTQQPESNYVNAAVTTVMQIHMSQGKGDILVFLTGQDEIDGMAETLNELKQSLGEQISPLMICPIYANLPPDEQKRIFEATPKGTRKVVIATNIAETSLTIDGIVFVVDSGFVKENVYKPITGVESLEIKLCSRASANQRAGRAGRVGPGKCFRLYPKSVYEEELPLNPLPEVLRVNLSSVILMMISMGITNLIKFDFMDSPSTKSMVKSLEELYSLGALNERGELTKIGKRMSEFPTNPKLSRALLASVELNCVSEVLSVVSMLEEVNGLWMNSKENKDKVRVSREQFYSKIGGDHITLLNVWNQWRENLGSSKWCFDNFIQIRTMKRVQRIRSQLERVVKTQLGDGIVTAGGKMEERMILNTMKAITTGLKMNVAKLAGDCYKTINGNEIVWVHPKSSLFGETPPPKTVVYQFTMKTQKCYMINVMPINPDWAN